MRRQIDGKEVWEMISELYIEQYRGIQNLRLEELGKINIIAGENNTGKSSILEVIQSLSAPNDLLHWRKICSRGEKLTLFSPSAYDLVKSLFPVDADRPSDRIRYGGKNDGEPFEVEISCEFSEELVTATGLGLRERYLEEGDDIAAEQEYETEVMELIYKINGKYSGRDRLYGLSHRTMYSGDEKRELIRNIVSISPVQHTQNFVFLDSLLDDPDLYEEFVEIIRQFDPHFITLNSVENEKSMGRKYLVLSRNHREGLLLNAYGDGMKKAMLLLSAVLKAKDGVLLLDEFETAIHVSAMEKVFRWILETADKRNVQMFMTSHSLEAIRTVLKCSPALRKDMRMITLVRVEGELKLRNVDGEKAMQLCDEYGLELR